MKKFKAKNNPTVIETRNDPLNPCLFKIGIHITSCSEYHDWVKLGYLLACPDLMDSQRTQRNNLYDL